MTIPIPPKEERPSIPVSEFEDEAWNALAAKFAEGKLEPKIKIKTQSPDETKGDEQA